MELRQLPASISHAPVSMVLRFDDSTAGNVAAYCIAHAIQSDFVLFEVRAPATAQHPADLPWSELVPADRHLVIWAPDPSGKEFPKGSAAWSVTQRDREEQPLTSLVDIMTAPEASQKAIGHLLPSARPLPILVANGALVGQVFPDDPSVTSHLIALQKQLQYSTISTSDSRVRRDHVVFDYLFDGRVVGDDAASIQLHCARAPWGGEWKRGDEFSLESVREFLPALDRLRRIRIPFGAGKLNSPIPHPGWDASDTPESPFAPAPLDRAADASVAGRPFAR